MADDEPEEVVATEEEPTTEGAAEVEIEMSVLDALKEVCCHYCFRESSFFKYQLMEHFIECFFDTEALTVSSDSPNRFCKRR